MKQFTIEFDDDEVELIEDQIRQIELLGEYHTIEEYVHYATMAHCHTMRAAAQMMSANPGEIENLMSDNNIHVGVVNMPVQIDSLDDKEEFSQFLNDVINDAIVDFNNRNNNQLN